MSNTLMLQYTGDRIDGSEAYRMGLVSKLVADDAIMEAALELATRLAQGPTQSLSLIKYPGAPQPGRWAERKPGNSPRSPGTGPQNRGPPGSGDGLPGKTPPVVQGSVGGNFSTFT